MLNCHARLFIPGPMPGMNEIVDARSRMNAPLPGSTKRHNAYSDMKRKWTSEVQTQALLARLKPGCVPPAYFTFLHFEMDRLRDPDNLCGGAQKLLLDGLKEARLIKNDGWRDVLGIQHWWCCKPAVDGWQAVGVQLFAADGPVPEQVAHDYAQPQIRRVETIQRPRPKEKRARRSVRAADLAR